MTSTLAKPPREFVTIATRGSQLALWQADYVAKLLASKGVASEKLVLTTTGDRVQDRFLHEIGGKGLFVKELEEALLDQRADLAVHSLKDMTVKLAAPFTIAAVLKRHSPLDAFIVTKEKQQQLGTASLLSAADLKAIGKITIGTGSLRRQSILQRSLPAAAMAGIRGNVDTRIRKLQQGEWDAIILAEASLKRLGIDSVAYKPLDPEWFIPSPSQGALAIESRVDDDLTAWLTSALGDPLTTLAVGVEREILARLGGDCTMPFACYVCPSTNKPEELQANAALYDRNGNAATARYQGPPGGSAGEGIVAALTMRLAEAGAGQILQSLGLQVPSHFE